MRLFATGPREAAGVCEGPAVHAVTQMREECRLFLRTGREVKGRLCLLRACRLCGDADAGRM